MAASSSLRRDYPSAASGQSEQKRINSAYFSTAFGGISGKAEKPAGGKVLARRKPQRLVRNVGTSL
jgi:hypothetical protein